MTATVLNRRLALQQRVTTPDGAGGFSVTWETVGHLFASVEARRGGERVVGARTLPSVSTLITVRSNPPGDSRRPTTEQRFLDGERVFAILAVSEEDPFGRYLTCWTEEGTLT